MILLEKYDTHLNNYFAIEHKKAWFHLLRGEGNCNTLDVTVLSESSPSSNLICLFSDYTPLMILTYYYFN